MRSERRREAAVAIVAGAAVALAGLLGATARPAAAAEPNAVPYLGMEVAKRQNSLRAVVSAAAELGLPAPGFSASLAYFDAYRSALLPVNLIQAQRDYFGAHTYERIDMPGKTFHTEWSEM